MRLSFFSCITDTEPKHADLTWQEFCDANAEHIYANHKKTQSPLFCPAEFREGGTRLDEDVLQVWLAVLDADTITDQEVEALLEACSPYEYLAYTSWSHSSDPNRLRVVLPLTEPVAAGDWDRFWPRMVFHLGNLADADCANVSRFYHEPYAPVGTEADNFIIRNQGKILDTAEVLKLPLPQGPIGRISKKKKGKKIPKKDGLSSLNLGLTAQSIAEDKPADDETLTTAHLKALQLRLKRRATAHAQLCAEALGAIREGLPFAEEGSRDDTLFRVLNEIMHAFPRATEESICALLGPSLDHMAALSSDAPDLDLVKDKLARAKLAKEEEEKAKAKVVEDDLRLRIYEAFRGTRDKPYTEQEAEHIAQNAGLTRKELDTHWIYQKGNSYYIRVLSEIRGPKIKAELTKVATIDLSPAGTLGVDPYTVTPTGIPIPKPPDLLVEDYGTPVAQVQASLIAQESYYDRKTSTLVEAACPLRKLDAIFDPEVAEWLKLLAGPMHEKLLDWLALVPDLTSPIPALYFDGPGGVGKTLFAEGLARLWSTEQATKMDVLARNFNSSLLGCPLVFADEYVPIEFRGDKGTGRLRELIAGRSRPLTRKFIPDSVLVGAIRLIIAGNNDSLISAEEHLTDEDIQAIVDRILYLETQGAAKEFLAGLPDLGDSFRYKDRLASHTLWLSINREVRIQGRFGIPGEAGKLHRNMTVGSGARSPVINWLVGAIANWDVVTARPKVARGLKIIDGEIHANTMALVDGWATVDTNAKPPSTRKIGQALAAISRKRNQVGGLNFRVIRTELLSAWCEQSGYMGVEELKAALDRAEKRQEKSVKEKQN